MQKIIFEHTDDQRAAQEALRRKLQADTADFLNRGGQIDVRRFGESSDPEARKVTGIENSDASRQVAARVNREHGGRMTQKQRDVMQAIRELSQIPGCVVTRQGVKNKMRLQFNILNDRLKALQNKKLIRVVGDEIVIC
jgi:hypothetical protein